jgi:hypothetical protein
MRLYICSQELLGKATGFASSLPLKRYGTLSANPDPSLKPYSRLSTSRHLVCRWGHHSHIPMLNMFSSAKMQGAVYPNEVSAVY